MKMRAWVVLVLALVLLSAVSDAQFRTQAVGESRVSDGLIEQSSGSSLFSWFNPEKFRMRHSLSFGFQSIGGQGLSMGTYTNSMSYEFSDKLDARADISLSYSPYNTFSTFGGTKNNFSSIYLSNAEVNYRPSENVIVRFSFNQLPYGSYSYSPFYSPWYRESGF
jgi:hypothetical protein